MLRMQEEGTYKAELSLKQVANDPMDKSLMANDQVKMDADYVQLHWTKGRFSLWEGSTETKGIWETKIEFITSTTNEGRDSADTNLIKQEVVRPLKSSKGKGLDSDEGNSECFMWAGLDIDSDQDTYSEQIYKTTHC
ncbi:hypothetical protein Tco_0815090 [Tanacetum coccineum]